MFKAHLRANHAEPEHINIKGSCGSLYHVQNQSSGESTDQGHLHWEMLSEAKRLC